MNFFSLFGDWRFQYSLTNLTSSLSYSVLAKYPDIDCIFLNAGFQRQENFSRPETVDLKVFHEQVHVNFLSFVDLTHAFLPILMKRESKSSII